MAAVVYVSESTMAFNVFDDVLPSPMGRGHVIVQKI